MDTESEQLRADVATLRAEVDKLHRELAELREYIGEVPAMECGITSFEEWQQQHA